MSPSSIPTPFPPRTLKCKGRNQYEQVQISDQRRRQRRTQCGTGRRNRRTRRDRGRRRPPAGATGQIEKVVPANRHRERLCPAPARDPARRGRRGRTGPPARRSDGDGVGAGLSRPGRKAAGHDGGRLPAHPRCRGAERCPRYDRPNDALYAPLARDGADGQIGRDWRRLLCPGRLHP